MFYFTHICLKNYIYAQKFTYMLKKSHCYIQVYRAILPYQNISRKVLLKEKMYNFKTIKNEKINFWLDSHGSVRICWECPKKVISRRP